MRFFQKSIWGLFILILVADLLWVVPNTNAIASDGESVEFVPNRVLVGLHADYLYIPEDSDSEEFEDAQWDKPLHDLLFQQGTHSISRIFTGFDPMDHSEYDNVPPLDRFFALSFSDDVDVRQICEELQRLDGVFFAEPDFYMYLPRDVEADIPPDFYSKAFPEDTDDLDWVNQWNLQDDSVGIRCPVAWEKTTGSTSVRIGYMEDLFKYDHYDLSHIDMSQGRRFWEAREDCPFPCNMVQHMDPIDLNASARSHATRGVGIIAAKSNNKRGIAGIAGGKSKVVGADGCTLVMLQFSNSISFTSSLVAFAIEQASDPSGVLQCDIITMSFGAISYNETLRGAIAYANSVRVNVVSGKGNSGNNIPNYPADYDEKWTVAVGGYGTDGLFCNGNAECDSFTSNYGVNIDLLAAAADYPSTSTETSSAYIDTLIQEFSQNSSAGPQVAGSLGLLRSFYYNNTLRAEDYENLLKLNSRDPHDGNPQTWNEFYGHGCLDIGTTLNTVASKTLDHYSALSSSSSALPDTTMKFFHGPYSDKIYDVIPYEVSGYVVFTKYSDPPITWGNCEDPMPLVKYGLSRSKPNYCTPYNDVVNSTVSKSGCDVVTYVYKVFDPDTEKFVGWYPQAPGSTWVACLALDSSTTKKAALGPRRSNSSILVSAKRGGNVDFSIRQDQLSSTGMKVATIFDLRGMAVAKVSGEVLSELVEFHWDGTTSRGARASSGVYFFSISSSGATLSKKFVLAR